MKRIPGTALLLCILLTMTACGQQPVSGNSHQTACGSKSVAAVSQRRLSRAHRCNIRALSSVHTPF